jgi:hypothetical protein
LALKNLKTQNIQNMETTRLVQLRHPEKGRRVALVKEPQLLLLENVTSIYGLALQAIDTDRKLLSLVSEIIGTETLEYNDVYNGNGNWELLPAFDHPESPFGCMVAGTGLTHKNSALNRQMMHQSATDKPTDSMQMYQWGVEGGWPENGTIGVQPEWFYKGNGNTLKAHNQPLEVPSYGNDGGEEPEVAGIYIIDHQGNARRIGFATGNEFSDHVMEKKNYLYLAPSKLRQCAIGPELAIDASFDDLQGRVAVLRNGQELWSSAVKTGENNMAHSLQNLEYHHFKYEGHRIPLQAHVHFFGADAFSFGSQIQLQDGDWMEVNWEGLGRALRNPIKIASEKEVLVTVEPV